MPISELCDKHGLQPTVFCRWQKEFFENGTAAFQPKERPNHSAGQERIAYLEKKIQTREEVLAELMAEHVAPKKTEPRGGWARSKITVIEKAAARRRGRGTETEKTEIQPLRLEAVLR